tara:strand:- start:240 stop:617 length:378 start_codon:yes stop_codon:yes gene_type:complete
MYVKDNLEMKTQLQEFLIFLFGGILFYIIYVIANKIKNPGLAAVVSLLPISLVCCYFITTPQILTNYLSSLVLVFLISFVVSLLGYLIVRKTNWCGIYFTSGLLLVWLVLQIILYYTVTHKFSKK